MFGVWAYTEAVGMSELFCKLTQSVVVCFLVATAASEVFGHSPALFPFRLFPSWVLFKLLHVLFLVCASCVLVLFLLAVIVGIGFPHLDPSCIQHFVSRTFRGSTLFKPMAISNTITVFAMGFTGLRHWLQRSGSATVAIPAFNNMQFIDTIAVFGLHGSTSLASAVRFGYGGNPSFQQHAVQRRSRGRRHGLHGSTPLASSGRFGYGGSPSFQQHAVQRHYHSRRYGLRGPTSLTTSVSCVWGKSCSANKFGCGCSIGTSLSLLGTYRRRGIQKKKQKTNTQNIYIYIYRDPSGALVEP